MDQPTNTPSRRKPEKPPQRTEFPTIAVVALMAAAVLGYIAWVKYFNRPFFLKAKFDYADGLKTGAEVRYGGVKVGSVQDIVFLGVPSESNPKEVFEIVLALSPKINDQPTGEIIRKDSKAVLIVTGALGDRSIDIEPGTHAAPPTMSGDYIRSSVEPTISMLLDRYEDMNTNFNRVREIMEASIKDIDENRGTVGKLSTGALNKEIQVVVDLTNQLQRQIERGNGSVGRFNKNSKELSKRLDRIRETADRLRTNFEKGEGSAGKFANDKNFQQNVERLQARFNRLSDAFEQVYDRVEKGNGSLSAFNKEPFQSDVRRLRESFNRISNMAEKQQGTAGLLLYDKRLSQNVNTISTEMIKLLYDIRQKPRKYVKFTLF